MYTTHLWHQPNQETGCLYSSIPHPQGSHLPYATHSPVPHSTHTCLQTTNDLLLVMIDLFALLEFYINGNIKYVLSFLGLASPSWCICFEVYPCIIYISFCWWVVFPLRGYTANLWTLICQWSFLCSPLCGQTLSVLLDEHLGVEWLGCRIGACLTLQETAKLFSKSGCHSTTITLHICLFI